MRPDAVSNRSTDSADSKKSSSKLRFLDLSFDGKDVMFKGEELDNGRFPHGGYKGSKRHPLSFYTFDKGREFHKQLRDDLDLEMEREEVGVFGGSPSWAVEAHKWPSNTGESPLLAHGFLPSSKLETMKEVGRLPPKSMRASAPAGSGTGVVYYRPNRVHHFLTATGSDLKDAADSEDLVRYGRPTRTTLLRARQKLNSSANGHEVRRQLDQRMEEIRLTCAFSNPKELLQLQSEVDGESFYSFLTGARYNRSSCVDSRSATQHGVFMPRHNPQGCYILPHRLDALDTTSAPPDSPRSDTEEGSPPDHLRPITAPGHGKKTTALGHVTHVPLPPSLPPHPVWGEAANGLEAEGGEDMALRVRGNRVFINSSREGPYKFEGKQLPRLRQPRENAADDTWETTQHPWPTPVPPYVKLDNSTLPAVMPEAETKTKAEESPQKPLEDKKDNQIPAEKTEEDTEKEREVEEQTKEEEKSEEPRQEPEDKAVEEPDTEKKEEGEQEEKEEEKEETTKEEEEKEEEEEGKEEEEEKTEEAKEQTTEANAETPADDTAAPADVTEDEQPPYDTEKTNQDIPEEESDSAAIRKETTGLSDDVKFFVTEGAGVDKVTGDVITQNEAVPEETADADILEEVVITDGNFAREKKEEELQEPPTDTDPKESSSQPRFEEEAVYETEALDTDRDEFEAEQGQGHTAPLKVIVTHIERNVPEAPKEEEEEEEIFAKHP